MNIGTHIATTILNSVDRILVNLGKMGSMQPVDDSKSGIQIGGKKYNTVVSFNGCYYYIDEDGKKKPVADLPEGSYEWVNIAEKTLQHFRTCYRTLGGKVEVWSWYQLNDEMEVLKEKHRITDSTDMDNPVGTTLDAIPEEWSMIDCDLPDMTERDVTPINRCYRTPGGKVEIEGIEAIDDKLQIRESIYRVLQTTDPDFPADFTFRTIPSDWVRMVCDFPDMTERDVTYVSECYTTEGGKVQIEGLRAFDNILGVREEVYTVIQTTDDEYPAGTKLSEIPDEWVRMVCDFPDMTDREIVEVDECYSTGNGVVEIKGYQARDAELGVREQHYFVVNTTDVNYAQWEIIDRVPNTWTLTTCDFPDMTQRHVITVNECYSTGNGKVRVGGYRSVDGLVGVRASYLIVPESSDDTVGRGTTYTGVPEGWEQVVCDFANQETADTEIVENCYSTGSGKVKLRTYLTLDGNGKLREARHLVMCSTDPAYTIGQDLEAIPVLWTRTDCDFASLTQRHVMTIRYCLESGTGKLYTEGYEVVDNKLNRERMKLIVMESTDPNINIGDSFESIPDGYTRVACMCNCN